MTRIRGAGRTGLRAPAPRLADGRRGPQGAARNRIARDVSKPGWRCHGRFDRTAPVGCRRCPVRQTKRIDAGNYSALIGLLRNASRDEEIPVVFLKPNEAKHHTVIWTHQEGKAGLFERGSELAVKPEIRKLLDAGVAVAGVDLLYQGEFFKDGKPLIRTPRVANPREAAAYTFGYNRAVFAQRVHDILTVAAFIRSQNEKPDRIDLVGLDGTVRSRLPRERRQATRSITQPSRRAGSDSAISSTCTTSISCLGEPSMAIFPLSWPWQRPASYGWRAKAANFPPSRERSTKWRTRQITWSPAPPPKAQLRRRSWIGFAESRNSSRF